MIAERLQDFLKKNRAIRQGASFKKGLLAIGRLVLAGRGRATGVEFEAKGLRLHYSKIGNGASLGLSSRLNCMMVRAQVFHLKIASLLLGGASDSAF